MKTNLNKLLSLAIVLFTAGTLHAQNTFPATGSVGIGTTTPNATSIFEVKSTTKGVLLPRMTSAQKSAIASPVTGLLIYQTDGTTGLYNYTGSKWKAVTSASWNLAGNSGTTASQFLGTSDNKSLRIKTNNLQRAVFDSLGNVGIGVTNPHASLDAYGSGLFWNQVISIGGPTGLPNERLWLTYDANIARARFSCAANVSLGLGTSGTNDQLVIDMWGNVGIGTNLPQAQLHVSGSALFNSNAIFSSNVGIGTAYPAYKLDVCGVIRSNEVRVEIGWCDYVFNDDYKLPALSEVEAFIKANKHLPDVTKGSVIETEGLEVGKTSSQMIRKIEELTLYVIDLQKQVDELKKNNK